MKNYIKKRGNVENGKLNIYNILADKLGLSLSAKKRGNVEREHVFTYEAPKKDITFKRCEVMQYFEYYDVYDLNVIKSRVQELTNIKTFAMIVHNNDVNDDGSPKKPHFHAVLTFSDSTRLSVISKALKVPCQYIGKIFTTTRLAQEYLIHKNDVTKYQYSPSDVISSFDYVEFLSKRDNTLKKERLESIANDILNGVIREYNLFSHVSIMEFATNKLFFQRCFEYRQESLKNISRSLNCVFITGTSGSGKTTFAKRFCEKNNLSCYVSSGGKNPLDDYKGQDCIILDDIRSSTYSLSEFLKLTDLHTNSNVGCRYYNKSIAECSTIICTSVQSLDDFYTNVVKEDNEPRIQLLRRFPTYIEMNTESVFFYEYDKATGRHKFVDMQPNYITSIFKENTKSLVDDFKKLFF